MACDVQGDQIWARLPLRKRFERQSGSTWEGPEVDEEGAQEDAQAVDEADRDGTLGARALEDARVPREEDVEVAVQAAEREDDGDVTCGCVERRCGDDEPAETVT